MLKFFKKKDKNNKADNKDNNASIEDTTVSKAGSTDIPNSEQQIDAEQRKAIASATTQVHEEVQETVESKTQEETQSEKLEQKLSKSRNGFGKKMKHVFSFKKSIDDDLFDDIETTLLMADVGAQATMEIVDNTAKSVKRRKLSDSTISIEIGPVTLEEDLVEFTGSADDYRAGDAAFEYGIDHGLEEWPHRDEIGLGLDDLLDKNTPQLLLYVLAV